MLKIIKRIIGVFSGIMCITSFSLAFSYEPVAVFIFMTVLFGIITFLCFKTKKANEKVEHIERITQVEVLDKVPNNQFFLDENIKSALRIINESFHIMQTTKNIDTLCSRYEVGLKNCYHLKEFEIAGLYKGNQTSDYFISMYMDNYHFLIKQCYDRFLSEVKTESGKAKRAEKFWNTLKQCVDEYTYSDIQEMFK